MKRKIFFGLSLVGVSLLSMGSRAERPPVDRKAVEKKIFVHCNPWFPIDVVGKHTVGGPNVPWEHYTGGTPWKRSMEVLSGYGVNGILLEINEPTYEIPVFRKLLDGAPDGFQILMHFGFYSKTIDETVTNIRNVLRPYAKDLAGSPHILRLNGRPVLFVYCLNNGRTVDYYREVFTRIDREVCPMTYLFCYSDLWMKGGWNEAKFETLVRDYLRVFDGVSTYSFSYEDVRVQRREARVLSKVMRENPGKVFFGGAFTTWTQPFVQAGLEVHLSRNWRESVDLWMSPSVGADAIELTNLFDHFEQSLVYPCYEREDLLLRYLQYAASCWRATPFPREKEPELVLCNYETAQLGWTPLDFEILGFPIDSPVTEVEASIQICDTAGRVLKTLGPRKMDLSRFSSEWFSVPSIDFASERAVVPRLVYRWNGKDRVAPYNPMTILSPSARNYRMYWARSTRNAYERRVREGDSEDWTLDGVHPGGTRRSTADGLGVFSSRISYHLQDGNPKRGYFRSGVRRDGVEFEFTNERHFALTSTLALQLPVPGGALHWYSLEIENRHGRRWQSLPIWETDGSRDRLVTMPILNATNGIVRCEIEDCRVPFFYWPCRRDGLELLLDESGYVHNGHFSTSTSGGYNGINYIGYNLYHNSSVGHAAGFKTLFRMDADGRGAIEFGGEDFCKVAGGTAFPGASTYEISVKPKSLGTRMGLLNTSAGHVLLSILPDGRVRAARRAAPISGADQFAYRWPEVVSRRSIPPNAWTRIAVVYDLEKIALYVDGELQGTSDAPPCYVDLGWGSKSNVTTSHENHNLLMIGAETDVTDIDNYKSLNRFKGRLREIRAYGRNLSPEEFLK